MDNMSKQDGRRTLLVASAELKQKQKRLSTALSKIQAATLHPPSPGLCNMSGECCVCRAREQLAQVQKLIAHYKAALEGLVAFGAAPSLALGVASKQNAAVRGVAAELEAALLFMQNTQTPWRGWRHTGIGVVDKNAGTSRSISRCNPPMTIKCN